MYLWRGVRVNRGWMHRLSNTVFAVPSRRWPPSARLNNIHLLPLTKSNQRLGMCQ